MIELEEIAEKKIILNDLKRKLNTSRMLLAN